MNSIDIRQALIQIAERNGRPHYTNIVVLAVLDANRNGLKHPLLDLIKGPFKSTQEQFSEIVEKYCGEEKVCSVCKESFPLTKEFFFGHNSKVGFKFDANCKACYKQKYGRSLIRSNNVAHRYVGATA